MLTRNLFRSALLAGSGLLSLRSARSAPKRRPAQRCPDFLTLESRLLLATYPLTSIPALNSLPGAKAALYLDFVGDYVSSWGSYSNITIPAFDQDGDPTTFSDGELTTITRIWEQVAEDFAPFNLNVTTVPPPSFAHGVTEQIDIGGDGAWTGGSYEGLSFVGSFTDPNLPNIGFVFSKNLGNGDPKYTAEDISHEAGHAFGLQHQSQYDSNGNLIAEYYAGPGDGTAPIMGCATYYRTPLSRWWYGTSSLGPTIMQDDMAVIASSTNGFGYRLAPTNMTAATAAPLAVSGSSVSGSGIIRLPTDDDYFSFTTGAGQVSLSALVQTGINNLVPRLELCDSTGSVLIASAGPDANYDATITTTLAAGSYRLVVADSDGHYGNVGQYTISGTIVPLATVNAPTNLTATAVSTSQVNLAWTDNATNETGYNVECSTNGVNWSVIASNLPANSTSYADATASAGTTYVYRVDAYNASSTSNYSNQATATTVTVAPSGLTATPVSPGQVNLAWSDLTGETGFRVERSLDRVTWGLVGTTGAGVTSFQDATVSIGTSYQYRVEAVNSGGTSSCSNVAAATTPAAPVPPAAPLGLVAVAGSATRVTLTWHDNSSNESGFYIERSTNGGKGWTQIAQVGSNVTSYTDTSVSACKTYSYRVCGYNSSGTSAYSNVAKVTTPKAARVVRPRRRSVRRPRLTR